MPGWQKKAGNCGGRPAYDRRDAVVPEWRRGRAALERDRRIACVGAGYWGANLVRNFYELGALARICEADPDRRMDLARRYASADLTGSLDAVLDDPGIAAVAIATPAPTHGELVRQCLLAGKDVFVEKPLCLSVTEGRELVDLARRQGRVLMVGHLLQYHPAVMKLKELAAAGELGRLQYIASHRLNLGRIRREENVLWSFAPHDISVILGLTGEMPASVSAHGGSYVSGQVTDVAVSTLAFPGGVKAHLFVSWLHPFKEQKLVVVGERQMAVFNDLEPPERKLQLYPHTIDWRQGVPVANPAEAVPVDLDWHEPLAAECRHFLDCIASRSEPRTDGAEGLRVLTVLDQCQRALAGEPAVASVKPYTVHESSYIDDNVAIGEGTAIWHFSHVRKNTRIGANCRIGQNVVAGPNVTIGNGVKIQNNVSVYDGVTLEDDVFCGPSMVFTNVHNPRSTMPRLDEIRPTLVRQGATLGANATVVCGVTIGRHAFVGAGAVVTRDVPDFGLAVGNPARVTGWVCQCGHRIAFTGDEGTCHTCGREYRRTGQVVALA
jgi:UDP-2-acetamido-3-amino-2,3-dideoxy-glucuronate N-acetyltransferase